MGETIAGITVPDSTLAKDATALVRDATNDLIYNHSRRTFFFGALRGERDGVDFDTVSDATRAEVVAAHSRPDFKNGILAAFTEGLKHRPETTFGNVKADVLAHFLPGFERGDFVEVVKNSDWPE